MSEIVNKISSSGLITFDLEELYIPGKRVAFDITPWLFEEMILKEKDFREKLKLHDWKQYEGKFVAVFCSADAIVPTWAYMLIAVQLSPFVKKIVFGSLEKLEEELFNEQIEKLDLSQFQDQRVVIKGCSTEKVPVNAYVKFTALLKPLVKSIMYGEPCSTVPIYKQGK